MPFCPQDFLGTDCITPDCTGKISSIHIYDETGNLKIELSNKKDKKNAQNSVKQKKKKWVLFFITVLILKYFVFVLTVCLLSISSAWINHDVDIFSMQG